MIPSISCAHTSTFLPHSNDEDDDVTAADDEATASVNETSESEQDNEPCGIPFL